MPRAGRSKSVSHRALALLAAAATVGVLAVVTADALARADLTPSSAARIPPLAFEAYRSASAQAPTVADGCRVDWAILAGVARVESTHGLMDGEHAIAADGSVTPAIRGPRLDGSGDTRPIIDTDGGALDGDASWDRAMGPFQFIPTTWAELGRDGNGDGVANPDNMHDAALTAVAHLCLREPGDYADPAQLRRAIVAYNASGRYADLVLGWIDRYRRATPEEMLVEAG